MYSPNDSLGFLVGKISHYMTLWLSDALAPYDITPPQFAILGLLNKCGMSTPSQLAEQYGCNQAVISRILVLLEKKELIIKHSNQKDRRSYMVSISQKGIDLFNETSDFPTRQTDMMLEGMNPSEITALLSQLFKLQERACDLDKQRSVNNDI